MSLTRYKLIGKLAVPVRGLMVWARWFETANRIVAQDQIGEIFVSTVFLSLDHNFSGRGDPLLFETMMFDDNEDGYQVRTSTWDEAERAHAEAVALARKRIADAEKLIPADWQKTNAGKC